MPSSELTDDNYLAGTCLWLSIWVCIYLWYSQYNELTKQQKQAIPIASLSRHCSGTLQLLEFQLSWLTWYLDCSHLLRKLRVGDMRIGWIWPSVFLYDLSTISSGRDGRFEYLDITACSLWKLYDLCIFKSLAEYCPFWYRNAVWPAIISE